MAKFNLASSIPNAIGNNKFINSIATKLGFISDDKAYIKHFDSYIGPNIYHRHLDDYFVCCTFCCHLKKSNCHSYCFKCGKNTYEECGVLLPGTFSFTGNHTNDQESDQPPWIFRTPCTGFERLSEKKYFKNFNSYIQSITVANYEAMEGIFTGISRGKSPCHICASVNIEIYNHCLSPDRNADNKYCNEIIEQISAKYRAIAGMIKYVE
ncbi:MAG: hypothetical protein N2484_18700 [Clostridia bacterium]|nr:hypothetical protein [Clostridia bacterium]